MKILLLTLLLFFQSPESQFYEDLNKLRQEHALNPLVRSTGLEAAARQGLLQCKSAATNWYTQNSNVVQRYWLAIGKMFLTLGWKPPHRAIILSARYTKIGLAFEGDDVCARLE